MEVWLMHRGLLSAVVVSALASGCLTESRFVTPEEGGIWAVSVDESTPPFFESEDGNVYLVEQRVLIDFREPTDEELAGMADVGSMAVPWASLPYVRRGDIEIQVDYTVSNISDEAVLAAVVVNGINEFHEYNPGVRIVDEDLLIDFAGWEHAFRLEPNERRTGTIREEELDEVAVDLSTVVNMAPNPNQIVYFENQSDSDRRSQMYIPEMIAALTGLRIGLRTDEAVPLVLEATIRVRDNRGVLVQGDDEPWVAPQPTLFGPEDVMMATPAP